MITEYLIKFDEEIKSCDVCPFCKTNDDLDSEDYRHMYCGYPQMGEFVTDYIACRHPDCPLKEVPTHGDLIERDELPLNHITDYNLEGHSVVDIEDVLNAPTIIEASEEKR